MDYNEFLRKWRAGELLTTDDLADVIEGIFDELDAIIAQLESESHMGAFDTIPNILIPDDDKDAASSVAFRKKWGWDAHEQIIVRGTFTAADQEQMENASSSLKGKGKARKIEMKTGSARRTLLERMIVSWTLSRQGQIVPVTRSEERRVG